MPQEPETHALAALVLLHDSRRATRVDEAGAPWCPSTSKTGPDGITAASPVGWTGCGGPADPGAPIYRKR